MRPLRTGLVLALLTAAFLGRPQAAGAVEADRIGWWIYAGSVRSTLLSRYLGPEAPTPADAAVARAGRQCGLTARVDALDTFAATPPGDAPVVFGPFLNRAALAASLACIRRSVPAAIIVQARPPAP
ncbi:hypothetical protein MKK88_04480 [Methylobacterium sp. E-005]|uniref:hypothetical protein n=1 Tax=Methylobacterium sp. E-005 TaxID=2836549 RepID=UPI001FBBB993|nr:hypothetical protein [Methylobacterium sp. E-005]MCJ2085252.1 hypothetical protein [Methylobacterium sp. E-005]